MDVQNMKKLKLNYKTDITNKLMVKRLCHRFIQYRQ